MPISIRSPLARRALRWLAALAIIPLLLYSLALAWLWWRQERLLFHPDPWPRQDPPVLSEPDVHSVWVDVAGARLHALHLRQPAARGLVFFLHGNAGNLASWFVNAEFYRRAGFDLFMLDYRGYGRSSGQIGSEAQLMADVRAAWRQVAPLYAGRPVVVYGRSLGTGLAAQLAAEVSPALTVLVSPYRSMAALADEQFPWVPTALLRYPLRTDAVVARISGPLWLVHGERDTLIPPTHSEALREAAGARARLLRVPDAGHNDVHESPNYLDGLRAELDRL
ncbi:alpha/beta hydrolase [Ideonella sp.]|uniref:alpha/beta hydrolase n=1 Tax=Ideonella sp. TaxID=1929293 RepID=UPI002B490C9F|nr:alpha/beta fold hydrolase [Ideonella sp.]HJV68042.1 alpha/beta fold hydrolase [Ideonella sp.]